MITKRLAVLLAALLAMGTVFFLPKQTVEQPVGVKLELPAAIGDWTGENMKITDKEISILGKETEFARKTYTNGRGDELQATIVLAGRDMNTGIHRPERCLLAQGWTQEDSSPVKVAVPERGTLTTTRLKEMQMVPGKEGRQFAYTNLNYYWFTGCAVTTGSHVRRTVIDISDRLLHGYNQRWAYFPVAATITKDMKKNGRTEEETDALIQDFIRRMVPETHLPAVKFGS